MNLQTGIWTRAPKEYTVGEDAVEIVTQPHTDLWQRTYYHFRNDSAPLLQWRTAEKFFSCTGRTQFDRKHLFDQCGVAAYFDSGYSDWATTAIDASVRSIWYRLSRREDDFCIECSYDGEHFTQMRICHMPVATGEVPFGIYACSPENSSMRARFTNFHFGECMWKAHVGQPPDKD